MDIPVSRLNERMALRLPAQFPLGLVFVVGTVEGLNAGANGDQPSAFFLSESDHRLRCRLSDRASRESELKNGYRIRAGGHLAFDSQHADYFLLARDVEVIPMEQPRVSSMAAIITDYTKRSEQAGLIPAELPDWVKRMAPPGIGVEAGISSVASSSSAFIPPAVKVEGATKKPHGLLGLGHDVAVAGLSDELIEFLSEAMDSEEEVELTPEMVAEYNRGESSSNTTITGSNLKLLQGVDQESLEPIFSEQAEGEESEDQEKEDSGKGKSRTKIWIFILGLLIIILIAAAAFILYQYVI
jgi:hypothetical protein